MVPLYPLLFSQDQFRPYMWGGQKLRSFVTPEFEGQPIAELWAIADRPEENIVSVITNGELAGRTIHQILVDYGKDLLGTARPTNGKFPLLIKLIDPLDNLSAQVHPPATIAGELGGEPKTEAWYILEGATPDAVLYAGLKPGTSKEDFGAALLEGTVARFFHALAVKPGDMLSIPSGRLHTIGKGCFLLEVQENSNTTYRVFDWNRIDKKTGQPRELHIDKAMRSIDFEDIEPSLENHSVETVGENIRRTLLRSPLFSMDSWTIKSDQKHRLADSFEVIFAEKGTIQLTGAETTVTIPPLHCCLIPFSVKAYIITTQATASYVRIFMEHQ